MEHDIDKILDVSTALELQVAALYLLFCHPYADMCASALLA
jgi:hypothetical protein